MTAIRDAVATLSPRCNALYLDALAANDATFEKYGINANPLRQSQFLGQFLGETAGGTVLQENLVYTHADRLLAIFGVGHSSAAITPDEADRIIAIPSDKRGQVIGERVYGAGCPHLMNELGNRPGDGFKFRGTGPLQSTGREAAKKWGDKLGVDFCTDPLVMLDPRWVWMPSLYEWQAGNLNVFADKNDGRHVRRIINGGYNGLAECEAWQERAYAALRNPAKHAPEPWRQAVADPGVSAIQNSLNLLGYRPALKLDGKYGPATKEAVGWFQGLAGVRVDGIAGPVTLAALNLRFASIRGGTP